jgi:hypothetical protein
MPQRRPSLDVTREKPPRQWLDVSSCDGRDIASSHVTRPATARAISGSTFTVERALSICRAP